MTCVSCEEKMMAINVFLQSFSSETFSAELQKKGVSGILQNTKQSEFKVTINCHDQLVLPIMLKIYSTK